MVIQFHFAKWFHSFQEFPATGFKAWHTDVRYIITTAYQPWTTGITIQSQWDKDILTHCIGYIQYRAEPKQVKAGVVVGEIQFGTIYFADCVFEMEGLKLTPYQCACVWSVQVSNQLIEGTWRECPTRTKYTQNGIAILDHSHLISDQSWHLFPDW